MQAAGSEEAGSPSPPGRARPAGGPVAGDAGLVELEAVRAAAERLRGVALRTPLLPGELPDGGRVWLKCEGLQHAGSFKIRGAYNFTALLPEGRRSGGLVTFSSGNHAQGVAFAARAFCVNATIVMPEDAPEVKVEGTRRLGGEVVFRGTTTAVRGEAAEEIVRERGGVMVPPFDHPDIVAGQGTAALEIVEQLEEERRRAAAGSGGGGDSGRDGSEAGGGEPGLLLVPVGGGGLISGHAVVFRALLPGWRIVGVEPEGAASMKRSLEAGEPVSLDTVDTVADGLKPLRPGDLTFRHCRELVDDVVTVTEDALLEGVRWCAARGLVVEPSGAATVAALLSGAATPEDGADAVAVLSGRNVDPARLGGWLAHD